MTEKHEKVNRAKALADFALRTKKDYMGINELPYSELEKNYTTTFANIYDKGTESQVSLSLEYYKKNGYYAQLIHHYATQLLYRGLLTPHSANGRFSKSALNVYNKALKAVDELNVSSNGKKIAFNVLLRGTHYGLLKVEGNSFSLIHLPRAYCKVVGQDKKGNLVISFNVEYFVSKDDILASYPKEIQQHFYKWKRNKAEVSSTIVLPTYMATAWQLFSPLPFFLRSIPDIERYKDALKKNDEKKESDIEKIVTQEIPHLNDGQLLFEPDEAAEMHKGLLEMTRGSRHTSVITSYGSVGLLTAPNRQASERNDLNQISTDIYSGAGVSKELFSASTSAAMTSTLKKDLSIMMTLAEQVANFIELAINHYFGTSTIEFSYDVLPISYYNQADYLKMTLSAANSGYSFFLPAIASGIDQSDLHNVKLLERELGLKDLLEPLSSSFTQSSEDSGRPTLKDEEKSDKTVANEEAGGNDAT